MISKNTAAPGVTSDHACGRLTFDNVTSYCVFPGGDFLDLFLDDGTLGADLDVTRSIETGSGASSTCGAVEADWFVAIGATDFTNFVVAHRR